LLRIFLCQNRCLALKLVFNDGKNLIPFIFLSNQSMKSTEPAFKIKTGNLPVLQLHVLQSDMSALKQQLGLRLSQTPDFFANTPIVLELSAINACVEDVDIASLVSFMRVRGMCAVGVVDGSVKQREAAVAAGLALFPDAPSRIALPKQVEVPAVIEQIVQPEPVEVAPVETVPVKLHKPTLVIDKPVRTGQRIYAEGGDLVVLAIVNAGAEVIADGDIHVYAPMRGKAIAGAKGNDGARIFVQGMEAELLSISGCFKVFEEDVAENVRGKPAQIHLEGSRLVITPLNC
jgi:septum site-determining protein MinC